MRSAVYVQHVLRRLSPTERQIVSAEFASASGREAIVSALCSPFPERALADLVWRRLAVRPSTGMGVETFTYGQAQKVRKASAADELAALKAAKRDKSSIVAARAALQAAKRSHDASAIESAKSAVHAAAQARKDEISADKAAYKEAYNVFDKVKTTKAERKEIVAEIGRAGQGYHWIYKRDNMTGELAAIRVKNQESGNFFSKVGRTLKPFVPIIIGVAGAVLAPFTGGASLAAAAVLSAGYQINQKRIQGNKVKRENRNAAKQIDKEVKAQTQQLNTQLDDLYKQHPEIFTAAGISSSKWNAMSVDQKLAVVDKINSGQMPSTAENVAAAADAQGGTPPATLPPDTPVDSTIANSQFMQPGGSVDPTPNASGGGGGTLLLLGAGALAAGAMMKHKK